MELIKKESIEDGRLKVWTETIDGKKHGELKEYYQYSSQVNFMITFNMGERTGPYFGWHENGNLAYEGTYLNSVTVGKYAEWYADKMRKSTNNYSTSGNGQYSGKSKAWYPDGRRKSVERFADGLKVGKQKHWHPNGVMSRKMYYTDNNVRYGKWIEQFESGKIKSVKYYLHDVLHGLSEEWYETEHGTHLRNQCNYTKGEIDGWFKRWYITGHLGEETLYVNGKQHGPSFKYCANGNPTFEGNYQNDKRHGHCKELTDKQLVLDCYYQNGWLHGARKEWDKKGLRLFDGNYKNGKYDGLCIWYKNDKVTEECYYQNGIKHGLCKVWSPDCLIESNYSNGKLHGKLIKKINDILVCSGEYVNGSENGVWTYYSVSGNFRSAMCFTNGQRVGLRVERTNGDLLVQ